MDSEFIRLTGDKVELIHLIDAKMWQARGQQLLSDFLDGVRRMKRCDEVALEHWGRILRMFVDQAYSGLVIPRAQQVDHQHRSTRACTKDGRSP